MTPLEARHLIDYSYWARDRVLDAVDVISPEQFNQNLGNSFGSIRDTLVHTMWAEALWLSRWRGAAEAPKFSPADFDNAAAVREEWRASETLMREYFADVDDDRLNAPIPYVGLNGLPFKTPLWQMLQHVVNHGGYHRGQITTMLRQLGFAPPKPMDMILYYREIG